MNDPKHINKHTTSIYLVMLSIQLRHIDGVSALVAARDKDEPFSRRPRSGSRVAVTRGLLVTLTQHDRDDDAADGP